MRQHNRLGKIYKKGRLLAASFVLFFGMFAPTISGVVSNTAAAQSATASQDIATGATTACAVVNYWVKCWGSNSQGQLGNGTTGSTQTTPVKVSDTSAMAGMDVQKVSVGNNHACAIANANVFCWGDNAFGQLGNRSNTDSSVPVKVDTQVENVTPTPSQSPNPCGGFLQPSCKTVTQPSRPKSALGLKEIIDVAAGENFTCALASDGTVACWGQGASGRLGTNSNANANYPQQVYNAAGSAFAGQKGVKLAKAAGATMCVLAVAAGDTAGIAKGSPYCWGYGVGDGTIPRNTSSTTACSGSSPTSAPSGSSSTTTYFSSAKPVKINTTQMFKAMDGDDYVTGLADSGKPYYWGMHGYRYNFGYANIRSCSIRVCTSSTLGKIKLASASTDRARANNQGGADRDRNRNSNNNSAASAQRTSSGGSNSYSSSTRAGGANYQGRATPGGSFSGQNVGGSNNNNNNTSSGSSSSSGGGGLFGWLGGLFNPSPGGAGGQPVNNPPAAPPPPPAPICRNVTHYGYTAQSTYTEVGTLTATAPASTSLTISTLVLMSGNVFSGLFCGVNSTGAYCDANGTGSSQGQTGSGYSSSSNCQKVGKVTTCTAGPSGPQKVSTTGWLGNKQIRQLSTGTTGYTCALASNEVGCWGANGSGQLGVGDTSSRNVPTKVNL